MSDSPYRMAAEYYERMSSGLTAGGEAKLAPVALAHYKIRDTDLAACLLTLGIPPREPAPYTDAVELDENGNEGKHLIDWWVGATNPTGTHQTEWLIGAWVMRDRFEREHPLHPMISMRAGIEARNWWVTALKAKRERRPSMDDQIPDCHSYITTSVREAAILKGCAFRPLAFTGHVFALQGAKDGVRAETIIAEANKPVGGSPPQWMDRAIKNYAHLLSIAKSQSIIVSQRFDAQTLLLSADSSPKTRDKFHRLIN